MSTIYKIHPAIGVARLGTAEPAPAKQQNYYLAPTAEGGLPSDPGSGDPVSSFRASDGKLLKQAAQFQVYAYEDGDTAGKPVALSDCGIKGIEWTVYLASKKAAWYQFEQLTGSGMKPDENLPGDKGYVENGPAVNPLRVNNQVADRQKLILDPGPRTVGGGQPASAKFDLPPGGSTANTAELPFGPNPIDHLGSVHAEDSGSLLVFGGDGNSGTTNLIPNGEPEYQITAYANNDGWFDDIADGPVNATLIMGDGSRVEVETSAWCIVGPPKYAPQVVNMVDLYDNIFDMAVREQNFRPDLFKDGEFVSDYVVDFNLEIKPLLARADGYKWVVNMDKEALDVDHNAKRGHKEIMLAWNMGWGFPRQFLRAPDDVNGNGALNLMPRLAGDAPFASSNPPSKYLTLTRTQTFLLNQWMAGPPKVAETVPGRAATGGAAIDFGVLRNCVGGAFCPGIEITWISRNPHIYSEPFRINARSGVTQGQLNALNGDDNLYQDGVEPGDLSKYMAQPWQADFNECDTQGDVSGAHAGSDWWWWPAQRPYNVKVDEEAEYADWTRGFVSAGKSVNYGDIQMVIDWQHLGFLKETSGGIFETEREADKFVSASTPPAWPDPPPPSVSNFT